MNLKDVLHYKGDRELRQNLALDEECTAKHSVCVHITLLRHVTLWFQWQVHCVEFYLHHPHMYLEHGDQFYISLTVHLGIIFVNNQIDALFSMYLFPFSTGFEQPSAHHQDN